MQNCASAVFLKCKIVQLQNSVNARLRRCEKLKCKIVHLLKKLLCTVVQLHNLAFKLFALAQPCIYGILQLHNLAFKKKCRCTILHLSETADAQFYRKVSDKGFVQLVIPITISFTTLCDLRRC